MFGKSMQTAVIDVPCDASAQFHFFFFCINQCLHLLFVWERLFGILPVFANVSKFITASTSASPSISMRFKLLRVPYFELAPLKLCIQCCTCPEQMDACAQKCLERDAAVVDGIMCALCVAINDSSSGHLKWFAFARAQYDSPMTD